MVHGYTACADRVCSHCDYVKCVHKYNESKMDEYLAFIVVKCRELAIRALLDTGAKVNVMDIQTMEELEMSHHLKPGGELVYGVTRTLLLGRQFIRLFSRVTFG